MVFEIFQTFQNSESRVKYLPARLNWYVFDFEIEQKKIIILMNVFNSHKGSITALFKIIKRPLGKDLKLSASFLINCRFHCVL